jgi:hypothetical protein
MGMSGFDRLRELAQNKRIRDQRLASARAVFNSLLPDEREQFLVEILAEMDSSESAGPPSKHVEAAPLNGSNGHRDADAGDGPLQVKDAIAAVLMDGVARPTGAIALAVQQRFPTINAKSVPAAVARMFRATPPQLVKKGTGDRGAPFYGLPE